jgi:hypothetical protein
MGFNGSDYRCGVDHGRGEDADSQSVGFLGALETGMQAAFVEVLMQKGESLQCHIV